MTSKLAVTQRRRAKGMSQADLARSAGITRQALGAIEAGRA
ncbi:MAG: helix-turn-helix transcriptional regulator, partial [Vulcanimicrobiaceae bacterium]